MSKGYSKNFIDMVNDADKNLLGVQLGSVCVKNDIPVSDVAEFLNVSRMTVYNWFKGSTRGCEPHLQKVEKLVNKLKN